MPRLFVYNTASNINTRYMLIIQAALLPGTFHTRQAVYIDNQTLPTRNAFTGQVSHVSDDATDLGSSGFGLMFYQSRWYDPSLGRMAQADTIVPGGVQGLDRYAYVNNSPLNYVDPSGHFGQCHDGQSGYQCRMTQQRAAQVNLRGQQAAQARTNISCRNLACDSSGIVSTGNSEGGVVVQGGGGIGGANRLDFTGYSDWERQILTKLYTEGGPEAVPVVLYMLENNIHICVGEKCQVGYWICTGDWQSDYPVGAWYEGNTVVLSPYYYDEGVMPDPWGLSLVIHEAHHIRQGKSVSLTQSGEYRAWQIGIRVYESLGGSLNAGMKAVMSAQSVHVFASAIQKHYPDYWKGLSLLPVYAPNWWAPYVP
jgi:RHS repeat-associated protein